MVPASVNESSASVSRQIELAVVGASAGAIEALSVVLAELPANFGIPIAIVVHLPAHAPSLLPALFASKCAIPTREIEDKLPLSRGVFFAPPGYHVLVESSGVFSLNADPPVNFSRPAIDVLFESAAATFGRSAMGILLTGGSSDGARGLLAIRDAGGFTVVQEPGSAAVATMPAAALELFEPDRVLALEDIATLLVGFGAQRDA